MTKERYFNNIETHPDWKPLISQWELEKEELKNKENKGKRDLNRLEKLDQIIEDKLKDIEKATEIWNFY